MQAAQLISDSFYLSGIEGRELSDVTNTETADGLRWLNQILSEKSINGSLIPYQKHYEFLSTVDEDEYLIPNLVNIISMTFNLDNVRFEMIRDSVYRYFGTFRVDDVQSLPFHYYAERYVGGTKIYLYFKPSQVFTMKITGKFGFTPVATPNDTMIYDDFYIKYLTYELCSQICDQYSISMPARAENTLINLRRSLRNLIGIDLTVRTKSFFPGSSTYDQSIAPIARGFVRG